MQDNFISYLIIFQDKCVQESFAAGVFLIFLGCTFAFFIVPAANIFWGYISKKTEQPSYITSLDTSKYALPIILAGTAILFVVSLYVLSIQFIHICKTPVP